MFVLIIVSDLAVGNSSESIVEACLLDEQPKSHHTLAKMMGIFSLFGANVLRDVTPDFDAGALTLPIFGAAKLHITLNLLDEKFFIK